jgi:Transposase DDE domain
MIREVSEGYDIDKVYADKAHNNRRSFNLLDNLNIEPAIQIRKNASIKTKRCPLLRDEVLLIRKLGYERWKQLKDTERRWIAEIAFSSLKRVLGENLLSKKFKAQKVEASMKILLCKLVFVCIIILSYTE